MPHWSPSSSSMQSAYFKDEVHIALLASDEHEQRANYQQPSSSPCAEPVEHSSPLLSLRSSLSSNTVFDDEDPYQHSSNTRNAFVRDRQHGSMRSESAETLVGNFISSRFPSLKAKFPSVLGPSTTGASPPTTMLKSQAKLHLGNVRSFSFC